MNYPEFAKYKTFCSANFVVQGVEFHELVEEEQILVAKDAPVGGQKTQADIFLTPDFGIGFQEDTRFFGEGGSTVRHSGNLQILAALDGGTDRSVANFIGAPGNFRSHEYKMDGFTVAELVTRAIKYFLEGLAVALATFIIPMKKLNMEEILAIAIVAAVTFALLDLLAPSIGLTARQGAGFGLGANLVGFPKL